MFSCIKKLLLLSTTMQENFLWLSNCQLSEVINDKRETIQASGFEINWRSLTVLAILKTERHEYHVLVCRKSIKLRTLGLFQNSQANSAKISTISTSKLEFRHVSDNSRKNNLIRAYSFYVIYFNLTVLCHKKFKKFTNTLSDAF